MKKLLAGAALLLFTSGCGLAHLFKAEPPAPKHVSEGLDGNGSCAEWRQILEGDDGQSDSAFECWASEANKIWTEVQTEKPGVMTERELSILVRKGIIAYPGDREILLKKLVATKTLLGFGGAGSDLTREKLDRWISWARVNRAQVRTLYQRMILRTHGETFSYHDLVDATHIASTALTEMSWNQSASDLATVVHTLLDTEGPIFEAAATPAVRLAMNALSVVCPAISDQEMVRTGEISTCFEQVPRHFEAAAPWIEFSVNPATDMGAKEIANVESSLHESESLFQEWFAQPGLKPLESSRWLDFAKAMNASPPANFIDSLKLIRKFNTRSNENFIYPEAADWIFKHIESDQLLVLTALPSLVENTRAHTCANSDAANWEECILAGSSDAQNGSLPDLVQLGYRVRDSHYAFKDDPINGKELSRVAFYNSLGDVILELFGNGKPEIEISLLNDDDGATELLTTGVQTYEAMDAYFSNLGRRLGNKSVRPQDTLDLAARWDIKGLAKLVAMTSDVLVNKPAQSRNLPENFVSKVASIEPQSSMTLDKDAITASLITLDGLSRIRAGYLNELGVASLYHSISRADLMKRLPAVLGREFPRTAQSCAAEGFDKTCGAVYDALIPETKPGSGFVNPGDLDIMTILALGVESVFDSCDENGDTKLSMGLMQKNSELNCGFVKIKDIVERLLESNILHTSPVQKAGMQAALGVADSFFITRAFGEAALVDGSMQGPLLLEVLVHGIAGGDATIGSTYALIAEIANKSK